MLNDRPNRAQCRRVDNAQRRKQRAPAYIRSDPPAICLRARIVVLCFGKLEHMSGRFSTAFAAKFDIKADIALFIRAPVNRQTKLIVDTATIGWYCCLTDVTADASCVSDGRYKA